MDNVINDANFEIFHAPYLQDKRQNMQSHYEHACHQHMVLLCSKLAEHDEKLNLQQRQLDTVSGQYATLTEISTRQERY